MAAMRDGTGADIDPSEAVLPVLIERERGVLACVGTASYLTRFGTFITAAHVFHDEHENVITGKVRLLHQTASGDLHLRPVRGVTLDEGMDVAVGQADNFIERFPRDPLRNRHAHMSSRLPNRGADLVTFAYPGNRPLDFRDPTSPPILRGDFFAGEMGDTNTLPYRFAATHFDMNVEIASGASGAPIFHEGRLVGIACSSWEFAAGEEPLSYAVPVSLLLGLEIAWPQIPEDSWEWNQIPQSARGHDITIERLVDFGLIDWEL